jgi:hypothetical protein
MRDGGLDGAVENGGAARVIKNMGFSHVLFDLQADYGHGGISLGSFANNLDKSLWRHQRHKFGCQRLGHIVAPAVHPVETVEEPFETPQRGSLPYPSSQERPNASRPSGTGPVEACA